MSDSRASWGARLADYLLSRARTPQLHEMDAGQLAIYRAGVAAGRAQAARKPPTAAEARMALLEALEAEAKRLRAQVYSLEQDIRERDGAVPEKGVL